MEKEMLISIIVPIYNAEPYLRQCLDSIVSQTYSNIEIILVNDGSTDSCAEICMCYAAKDSRIKYIYQKNAGVSVARNSGIDAASGEYVVFVDADDLLMPWMCEAVSKCKGCWDVILFGVHNFRGEYTDRKPLTTQWTMCSALEKTDRQTWVRALLGDSQQLTEESVKLSPSWAKAYRRDFLGTYGIHFSKGIPMGEDLLFNLRVYLKSPKVCTISAVAYCYRQVAASAIRRYNPRFSDNNRKFHEELRNILEEEKIDVFFRDEVEYQKINGLLLTLFNDIFCWDNPKLEKEKRSDFLKIILQDDYERQFVLQRHRFGALQRLILYFALKKQYYVVKVLILIRNLAKRAIKLIVKGK